MDRGLMKGMANKSKQVCTRKEIPWKEPQRCCGVIMANGLLCLRRNFSENRMHEEQKAVTEGRDSSLSSIGTYPVSAMERAIER